jgi:polyhydroxybutyrate depolymerase
MLVARQNPPYAKIGKIAKITSRPVHIRISSMRSRRRLNLGALIWTAVLALALGGCARDEKRIKVDGESRSYTLHLPKGYSGEVAAPLVLALHPFLSTASMMADMTALNALADEQGFIVAYPNGRRWSWNSTGEGEAKDPLFLNLLIDSVSQDYRVDPTRIYATGASAGGMMVQRFACQSDRLAAIAPVMSSIQSLAAENCATRTPLPVLMIHGRKDPIVPYTGGAVRGPPGKPMRFLSVPEAAAFWAKRNGCADDQAVTEFLQGTDQRVERKHYSCPEGAPVTLYSFAEGGHTWPGHYNIAPKFIVGPTSMDVDATRAIWEFFSTHARSAK